jgi:hypothetical protein
MKSIEALKAGAPAVLAAYAKNETSDPRALRTLQDERLRHVVAHAAAHVPFWKRRFARFGVRPTEVRSIKDLAVLPPLEDRDLVDFGDDLVTDGTPDAAWFTSHALDVPERLVRVDQKARRELADELRHVVDRTRLAHAAHRSSAAAERGHPGRRAAEIRRAPQRRVAACGAIPRRTTCARSPLARRTEVRGLPTGPPSALERIADACEAVRPPATRPTGRRRSVVGRAAVVRAPPTAPVALGTRVFDAYRTRETGGPRTRVRRTRRTA